MFIACSIIFHTDAEVLQGPTYNLGFSHVIRSNAGGFCAGSGHVCPAACVDCKGCCAPQSHLKSCLLCRSKKAMTSRASGVLSAALASLCAASSCQRTPTPSTSRCAPPSDTVSHSSPRKHRHAEHVRPGGPAAEVTSTHRQLGSPLGTKWDPQVLCHCKWLSRMCVHQSDTVCLHSGSHALHLQ